MTRRTFRTIQPLTTTFRPGTTPERRVHRGIRVPATFEQVRPGEIVRIRTERWRVARVSSFTGAAIIDTAGVDAANRGRTARFILPFEPLERIPFVATPRVVRPGEWRRLARATLASATPSPVSLRAAAAAQIGRAHV
jgi:hypothetical protein